MNNDISFSLTVKNNCSMTFDIEEQTMTVHGCELSTVKALELIEDLRSKMKKKTDIPSKHHAAGDRVFNNLGEEATVLEANCENMTVEIVSCGIKMLIDKSCFGLWKSK